MARPARLLARVSSLSRSSRSTWKSEQVRRDQAILGLSLCDPTPFRLHRTAPFGKIVGSRRLGFVIASLSSPEAYYREGFAFPHQSTRRLPVVSLQPDSRQTDGVD